MIQGLAGGRGRLDLPRTRRWTARLPAPQGVRPVILPVILLTTLQAVPAGALSGSGLSAPDTLDSRPPAVSLLHPLGGEEFSGATAETLRFEVHEDSWEPASSSIRLRVVTEEQELLSVEEPAGGQAADYAYPWTLPDLTVKARVIVVAVDRYGWATAESSGTFRILHSLTQAELSETPHRPGLAACYPNPFNPVTTVPFALQREAGIELAVFDLRGRRLATLAEGSWPAGWHTATWDGRDQAGQPAASGTYLARLRVRDPAGDYTFVQRMTLVK
jgi:hypothetical protein